MSDTHDERGGDESAALTVAQYADRYMAYGDGRSDMDPGRPPIEAMWRVRKQLRDLRKQLAAATARAETAEAEAGRLSDVNYHVNQGAVFYQQKYDDVVRERDQGRAAAAVYAANDKLRTERDEARARLAELGEPEVEYGLQYGAAAPQALRAQDEIAYYRRQRHSGLRVRDAYRSQWRLAPETGCRSCGTTDRVLGDPPLCSNCAVYAPASFTGLLAAPRLASDAAQDGLSATETDADGSQGSGVELEFGKGAAGLSACCRATKVEGGVRHHCDSDAPHDTHECGDCAHRWDDTTEDGQHG